MLLLLLLLLLKLKLLLQSKFTPHNLFLFTHTLSLSIINSLLLSLPSIINSLLPLSPPRWLLTISLSLLSSPVSLFLSLSLSSFTLPLTSSSLSLSLILSLYCHPLSLSLFRSRRPLDLYPFSIVVPCLLSVSSGITDTVTVTVPIICLSTKSF